MQQAIEMLGPGAASLEEIERESYQGHEVWSITLNVPRSPAAFFRAQYKRFLIDADTGELVAMKLREPVVQ